MADRPKRITTKDLARELGVSRATIDRALHGRGRINEETRRRIVERAKALDFQPNVVARRLALNRTARVFILLPREPRIFFDRIDRGVRDALATFSTMGIDATIRRAAHHDAPRQRDVLATLDPTEVDALILVPANTHDLDEHIRRLADRGMPVVTITTDAPDSGRTTFIGEDSPASGRLAGEVLGKMVGTGKILVLTGFHDVHAHTGRIAGFRAEMKEFFPGIELTAPIEYRDDPIKAEEIVCEVLREDDSIRGVYVNSGIGAVGAGRALERMHRETLPVVGYDLSDITRDFLRRGVIDAVIEQAPYDQGYRAVRLVYEYLIQGARNHPSRVNMPLQLVMRNNLATVSPHVS